MPKTDCPTTLKELRNSFRKASQDPKKSAKKAKKSSSKKNCMENLHKSTFPASAKEKEILKKATFSEAEVFVGTGISGESIPIAYQASEYIKKNHVVFANCKKHCLYIYEPQKGIYEMTSDDKFGVFMSEVFKDSPLEPYLTESLQKKIFHHLLNDYKMQKDSNSFENQERYLNVANGVVDLKTGKLLKHSPKYGFLHMLNLEYDPVFACGKDKPKKFCKMVRRNFPDPKDQLRFLQCLAYLISNRFTNKVAFYWLGPPHTGKSTYQRLISKIVGKEQVANLSLRNLAKPFAIATLCDKKLNFCGETGRAPIKNLDVFKALLGNDFIDAEYKFQDHFSFRGKTKCVFAGNEILNIDCNIAEEAIFTRFEFIVFQNPFKVGKQVSLYEEQLIQKEGREILSFLIRVLRKWYEDDCIFMESKSSKKEKNRFRRQSKPVDVIKAFVKHCCELKASADVSYKSLYNCYFAYCDSNCFTPMPQQTFIKQVTIVTDAKRHKFHPSKNLQFWGLKGIGLQKAVPPVPPVP